MTRTTKDQTFCRNEYNATGLCSRQSCPLANSRYATVRANPTTGALYLFMKTAERAHTPAKWWERIRLSPHYATALEQLDARLAYWPKFLVHKCKQRLTRLTQVALRARRLAREEARLDEHTVARLAPKVRRREETRERKAEAAARVERQIERELVERLTSGAYGEQPMNVDEKVWAKVLKALERAGEGERDKDLDEGVVEEEWEEEEELLDREGDVEYVSDAGESDEDDLADLEDFLGSDEDAAVGSEDVSVDGENDGDDDNDDDDGEELKKVLNGLGKRKRDDRPASKPSKRPAKSVTKKGPKRDIEYEMEGPIRDVQYA